MKLNKLQQRIVSILEPLPIENKHLAPTGIIEPLQIKIGETVTGWLRSLEPEEFIAYGWYHRLHALQVSKAFRVNWKNTDKHHDILEILSVS